MTHCVIARMEGGNLERYRKVTVTAVWSERRAAADHRTMGGGMACETFVCVGALAGKVVATLSKDDWMTVGSSRSAV